MIRALDFLLLAVAITAINFWNDGKLSHIWIICALVAATNVVGFFHGLLRK